MTASDEETAIENGLELAETPCWRRWEYGMECEISLAMVILMPSQSHMDR